MKILFPSALLLLLGMTLCCAEKTAGVSTHDVLNNHIAPPQQRDNKSMSNTIKMTIGASTFTVKLADNASSAAFKALLPLTIAMNDVNRNEKYHHLSTPLPTTAANPGKIHAGDLMLWGSHGLVLFYKTFSTSYSYTSLGHIDNPDGLAPALSSGNATVTFELK